jgi:germination protein M
MTFARALVIAAATVVAAVLVWLLFIGLPRWYGPHPAKVAAAPAAAQAAAPGRKIKARLLYVADDGVKLVDAEQEVPFAEATADQAKAIVAAQLAPAAAPRVSAVPPGTTLRALFVTDKGDAYVDLSREFATAHTGGTTDELLSIYTIVNVLTLNMPAVHSVQVLIDGKEVETLAGHVDLRRPLAKNAALMQ